MTRGQDGVIRQLQSLYESGSVGGLTDGELLWRFTTQHGDAPELAFAVIVERHGPMVLGVCRRILHDSHHAQDAFQATFLILARKADSLRLEGSLGGWLHGVAVRVARRVRATVLSYKSREMPLFIDAEPAETVDLDRFELQAILDQELNGLPATYRAALVLCHLEGLTHEQAAQQLGWPVGTVRSRLARGRARLRGRLLRRGFASGAGVSAALTEGLASTINAGLVKETTRSTLRFVQGGAPTGSIPTVIASLAEEVLMTMFTTKMKMVAMTLLTVGLFATGAAVMAQIEASGEHNEGPTPGRQTPRQLLARRQPARPATEILAEIDALYKKHARANMDPGQFAKVLEDPVARRDYRQEQLQTVMRRDQLVWEMFKAYPDHERIPKLLSLRWMQIPRVVDPKAAEQTLSEIDKALTECKNPRLVTDVAFLRAEFVLRMCVLGPDAEGFKPTIVAIEEAIRHSPLDLRGPRLLMGLLQQVDLPPETRDQVIARILKGYPDSPHAEMVLKSRRRQESVGKAFELEFTDAIRGAKVSMKALRGKVVVIDFWSTGCGPCVAELPKLKSLYAKYHEQGVEFIGVNGDAPVEKGGLDRLKAFVEKYQIAWPQYHQEGSGDGSFSDTWGVYLLPTVFVVDAEGRLASIDARGRLDQLIPTLLASKKKSMEK